ncbi:unnamed protein product [Pieris brassicae]|uniref:Uncharacterized protein n=1 Tax=Pieris brassicae TaxID=7116 RepID=A0A9P0TTH9_PIEBR|nr:unnamed protein product [Pieris brassicae]
MNRLKSHNVLYSIKGPYHILIVAFLVVATVIHPAGHAGSWHITAEGPALQTARCNTRELANFKRDNRVSQMFANCVVSHGVARAEHRSVPLRMPPLNPDSAKE